MNTVKNFEIKNLRFRTMPVDTSYQKGYGFKILRSIIIKLKSFKMVS